MVGGSEVVEHCKAKSVNLLLCHMLQCLSVFQSYIQYLLSLLVYFVHFVVALPSIKHAGFQECE